MCVIYQDFILLQGILAPQWEQVEGWVKSSHLLNHLGNTETLNQEPWTCKICLDNTETLNSKIIQSCVGSIANTEVTAKTRLKVEKFYALLQYLQTCWFTPSGTNTIAVQTTLRQDFHFHKNCWSCKSLTAASWHSSRSFQSCYLLLPPSTSVHPSTASNYF